MLWINQDISTTYNIYKWGKRAETIHRSIVGTAWSWSIDGFVDVVAFLMIHSSKINVDVDFQSVYLLSKPNILNVNHFHKIGRFSIVVYFYNIEKKREKESTCVLHASPVKMKTSLDAIASSPTWLCRFHATWMSIGQ